MARVIHILHHGFALCLFCGKRPPDHWPPGHRWVSLDERLGASCPKCLANSDAIMGRRVGPAEFHAAAQGVRDAWEPGDEEIMEAAKMPHGPVYVPGPGSRPDVKGRLTRKSKSENVLVTVDAQPKGESVPVLFAVGARDRLRDECDGADLVSKTLKSIGAESMAWVVGDLADTLRLIVDPPKGAEGVLLDLVGSERHEAVVAETEKNEMMRGLTKLDALPSVSKAEPSPLRCLCGAKMMSQLVAADDGKDRTVEDVDKMSMEEMLAATHAGYICSLPIGEHQARIAAYEATRCGAVSNKYEWWVCEREAGHYDKTSAHEWSGHRWFDPPPGGVN